MYLLQSAEYANELMEKAIQLCSTNVYRSKLPEAPPPLASQCDHPDKDTIPLFSRYNN